MRLRPISRRHRHLPHIIPLRLHGALLHIEGLYYAGYLAIAGGIVVFEGFDGGHLDGAVYHFGPFLSDDLFLFLQLFDQFRLDNRLLLIHFFDHFHSLLYRFQLLLIAVILIAKSRINFLLFQLLVEIEGDHHFAHRGAHRFATCHG